MSRYCPLFTVRSMFLLIFVLGAVSSAIAQSATATLGGVVVDANRAVVPGAKVTVTNPTTGLQRQTTTNEHGSFTVLLLPPSAYTVSVEGQGFAPAEVKDVVLNVGDQKSLQIQLKVGQVGATVDVKSDSPLINESPAVGTVVDRQFVENMPLNGRSFQSLIALTPGVVINKTNATEDGQFSINGQRADANYFMVDGVGANIGVSPNAAPNQHSGGSLPALTTFGSTSNLVSVDALQEFRVQTSTYAPEFGRTAGGQISIVTRSGGNSFTGTVFNYFRNDALDANDWFTNLNGLAKPPLRQNDFGGVFGGPIVKNKAFFFFSYEGLRLRLPVSTTTEVPSLVTRQLATPQIQPLMNAFPLPNGPDFRDAAGNLTGTSQFSASYSDPSSLNATSVRIDYEPISKLTLFGRYNYAPSHSDSRTFALNTITSSRAKTQTLTIGTTQTITPRVVNDFRANWSKTEGGSFDLMDDFEGAASPSDSILFPQFASRDDSQIRYSLAGTNAVSSLGRSVDNFQRQVNLIDNLSIAIRSHQFKFGLDYRRLSPTFGPLKYSQSVDFTIARTRTGQAAVSLSAHDTVDVIFNNYSAFAQDTWQTSRRLTITYGVRWEHNPPPSGQNGEPLFTVQGIDNPLTMTLGPGGAPLWKASAFNFAPRVGVAYHLAQHQDWEMLLRGGWGIFYDLGSGQATNGANGFPYVRTKSLGTVSFPLDPALAAAPPFSLSPQPPSNRYGTITAFDPNLKLPRVYQWNLALEQSLGANQTLSATYSGAVGRRLMRRETLTNVGSSILINPIFSSVLLIKNVATSDYHALYVQYNRRLSRGLQALGSYTWAHSIDSASADSIVFAASAKIDPNTDRGPSDFDVRHTFTAAITYDIPAPKLGSVGKLILRGWSTDSIFIARSATPVNVITGGDTLLTSLSGSLGVARPDLVLGVPLYVDDPTVAGGKRINRAAFVIPVGRQGTLGRNALRGFPMWQMNFSLRRQFSLTERVKLRLGAEFFNIFNHPNFGNPAGRLSSGLFGVSADILGRSLGSSGSGGGFSSLYQIGGPRSTQLSLKLKF
jgi:hypothetical protein